MIANVAAKPLFFMHIPRTGGISLMQYLDQKFPRAAICQVIEMIYVSELKI